MKNKIISLVVIISVMAIHLFTILPNARADDYVYEELSNSAYGGKSYRLKWDNLPEGSIISWDWYAEKEGLIGDDPAYIYFWIEDSNGNTVEEIISAPDDVSEYTIKSSGEYKVYWEYFDEDVSEYETVNLYYKINAKKPVSESGGNGGDDSAPGFEIIGFFVGISIAMIFTINKKRK